MPRIILNDEAPTTVPHFMGEEKRKTPAVEPPGRIALL
jgi:hypothetical protein